MFTGFLPNFKDVINFASRIYYPKISSNDCTDAEKKIPLTWALMSSDEFSITEIKLYVGKKLNNVDNKEEIEDIFWDITCKYSLTIFSTN